MRTRKRHANPAALGVHTLAPLACLNNTLVIPRLAAEVPTTITVCDGAGSLYEIAAALLRGGVLQEHDWSGDLIGSVKNGLQRWIADQEPVGGLHFLDVTLGYTGDISRWGMSAEQWIEEAEGNPNSDVGAFALVVGDTSEAIVGPAITKLNQIAPNAGWNIYSLLESALMRTVMVASFRWASELVDSGYLQDDDEGLDDGRITYHNWMDNVPDALVGPETFGWDPEPVKAAADILAAKADRDGHDYGTLWSACMESLRLAEALNRPFHGDIGERPIGTGYVPFDRSLCHRGIVHEEPVEAWMPLALRWSQSDTLASIIDDQHESVRRGGYGCDLNWVHGFQLSYLTGLDRAVGALKKVVDLVVRSDRLLRLLDPCRERFAPLTYGHSEKGWDDLREDQPTDETDDETNEEED